MTKATIEAKIQDILNSKISLELVIEHLEQDIDWRKLSKQDIDSLCSFLSQAGYHGLLTKLLATNAQIISKFPWPQFIEALFKACSVVPDDLKNSILAGAAEDNALEELSRSSALDNWDQFLIAARVNRKQSLRLKALELRSDLLQQVEVLKVQGLYEQEEKTLVRLLRLFPGDDEAYSNLLNCRERKALDALARRTSHRARPRPVEIKDPKEAPILRAIEESQKNHVASAPELAVDFSISHWMWDNPEAGLRFLENQGHSPSRDWLRLDLLLKARRYIEILEEVYALENRYSSDPETIMASIYYRAQALWGLGEKFQAMEILESLCASQPDFRSAAVLLAEMKEDFD